jgi:HD-GYP domain-containing protein (c-di-GMP phosphodiesterase class II)
MESLLSFFFTSVWRVSWWEYHVLMLLGVTTILYGMVLHYRRGASLPRTISALLLKGSIEALEQSYSEVLTGLIAAVEARDPYTKGHSEKVARMAVRIGEQLGLQPERLRVLHQAGLVHDIGKIAVPDSILNKPVRLTPAEMAVVREHPVRSEEMIGRIPSLRPTLRAIRWHHERLDGSGYPDGLAGDDIPFDACILAVADVFDAMTSGRSYRAAWPEHVAISHLMQEAGRLYDSRCVRAIEEIVRGRTEESGAGVPQPLLTKP